MMIDDDGETGSYGVLTSEPLRMAPVAIPSSFGETRQRLSRNTCPEGRKSKNEKEIRRSKKKKNGYLLRPYAHRLTRINPSKVKRLMSKQNPTSGEFFFYPWLEPREQNSTNLHQRKFFSFSFFSEFSFLLTKKENIFRRSRVSHGAFSSFAEKNVRGGKNYEINGSCWKYCLQWEPY